MKTLTLSTILVALVATGLAACGDKNKKTATTTETASDTSRGPDGEAGKDESSGEQDLAARDPSLTPVIFFEFDSSTLSQEARDELAENAEWLKQDPARTLTIEGHTDEVGTTEYNVALGIDASRVQILSYGEEKPASSEDSQNRRAMFIATKK